MGIKDIEEKRFFDQKRFEEELYETCAKQMAKLEDIIKRNIIENQAFLQEQKDADAEIQERFEKAIEKFKEDMKQFQDNEKHIQDVLKKEDLDVLQKKLADLVKSYEEIIGRLIGYVIELNKDLVDLNKTHTKSVDHISIIADQIINAFQVGEFKNHNINSAEIKNLIQDSMQDLFARLKDPLYKKEGSDELQLREDALQPKNFMEVAASVIKGQIKSYVAQSADPVVRENAAYIAQVTTDKFTDQLQTAISPSLAKLQSNFETIEATVEIRDAHIKEQSDLKRDKENLLQAGKSVTKSESPIADKIQSISQTIQHGETIVTEASKSLALRSSRLARRAAKNEAASHQSKPEDSLPIQLPLPRPSSK